MATPGVKAPSGFLLGCVVCLPLVVVAYLRPWTAGWTGTPHAPPVESVIADPHTARHGGQPHGAQPPPAVHAPGIEPPPPDPTVPDYVGFDPPSLDLGPRDWGTTVPVELAFVNRGAGPVRIADVKTSCGCTVPDADYKGRVVAPGERIPFALSLATEHTTGPKRRTVTATLDDGRALRADLAVEVVGTFRVAPQDVDFGDVDTDDEQTPAARLVTFHSDAHKIAGTPAADSDWLQTAVAERGGGRTDVLISLVKDRLPPGHSVGSVTIHTTDTRVPAAVVMVRVRAVPQLVPIPGYVFLRGTEPQTVRFTTLDGEPVAIVSAESGDPAIVVKVLANGTIDVSNPGGSVLADSVVIRARAKDRRRGRVQAATFPTAHR